MEHVGQSSQLNSVAGQHRHNGLRTIVKYIVGATAVASIVGRALATEIAQQQPEQKGDVIEQNGDVIEPKKDVVEQKGEQKKEVKSSGMFSFGKKSKKQDPYAANTVDITKTSSTKKTGVNNMSIELGPVKHKAAWRKDVDVDMKVVQERLQRVLSCITNYTPENPNFGISENIAGVLNKKGSIEVPKEIAQDLYVLKSGKVRRYQWDYFKDEFARFLADLVIDDLIGPRPTKGISVVRSQAFDKTMKHIKTSLKKIPNLKVE
ncbi:hypothetical protein protein, putative [Babesia ovis]|uniref:DUF1411 domain-containing protein n=1 Tax=Babesia ovis TaxID=5869 RepID=A0A9W5TA34_BABOV|nr:hypothetical protein protein, putative [Babesia ovis]